MSTYEFKGNLNIKKENNENGNLIIENKLYTNEVNTISGDLILTSQTGNVKINNINFPTSGSENQIIKTDGVNNLSFINQYKQLSIGGTNVNTNNSSYRRVVTFRYSGSNVDGLINNVNIVVNTQNGVMGARLYDLTNVNTIAEILTINDAAGYIIKNLGTVSNVPTSEAILEFQTRKISGPSPVIFYAGQLYFD